MIERKELERYCKAKCKEYKELLKGQNDRYQIDELPLNVCYLQVYNGEVSNMYPSKTTHWTNTTRDIQKFTDLTYLLFIDVFIPIITFSYYKIRKKR